MTFERPAATRRTRLTPCYNHQFMTEFILSILAAVRVFLRSRGDTALEVLALRQCTGKTGFPGFGFLRQRDDCALWGPRLIPKRKTATRRIQGRRLGVYWPRAGREDWNPGWQERPMGSAWAALNVQTWAE